MPTTVPPVLKTGPPTLPGASLKSATFACGSTRMTSPTDEILRAAERSTERDDLLPVCERLRFRSGRAVSRYDDTPCPCLLLRQVRLLLRSRWTARPDRNRPSKTGRGRRDRCSVPRREGCVGREVLHAEAQGTSPTSGSRPAALAVRSSVRAARSSGSRWLWTTRTSEGAGTLALSRSTGCEAVRRRRRRCRRRTACRHASSRGAPQACLPTRSTRRRRAAGQPEPLSDSTSDFDSPF